MRKLTVDEDQALWALNRRGSLALGPIDSPAKERVYRLMQSLLRKKRVYVEETDDGPAFRPLSNA